MAERGLISTRLAASTRSGFLRRVLTGADYSNRPRSQSPRRSTAGSPVVCSIEIPTKTYQKLKSGLQGSQRRALPANPISVLYAGSNHPVHRRKPLGAALLRRGLFGQPLYTPSGAFMQPKYDRELKNRPNRSGLFRFSTSNPHPFHSPRVLIIGVVRHDSTPPRCIPQRAYQLPAGPYNDRKDKLGTEPVRTPCRFLVCSLTISTWMRRLAAGCYSRTPVISAVWVGGVR
jgi:hypothetical protein